MAMISPALPSLTNSNLYHSLVHNHSYLTVPTIKINKISSSSNTFTASSTTINLSHSLSLILNSTLSLISILLLVNYCQSFLAIVEYLSTQTHSVFLNLVLPSFPHLTSTSHYTANPTFSYFITTIYLYLSYIGLSAQLAFTIDLFYLYNLPTIYMYKLLTSAYSYLLAILTFLLKVYQYDQQNWLSCQYPILKFKGTENVNKLVAICGMVVLGQVLVIVAFYYIWLAFVIVFLVCFINFVRNLAMTVEYFVEILLVVKAYQHHRQSKQQP